MSWTCTLSTSPSLGDLHSFCMTGRAVVCLDGAFGTALADNGRQYSSCTIEFGEKICPYCTIKYVCDSYLHHMTRILAANQLGSSSGLHRTDVCSHKAYWIHSRVCPELINLTMSWSASTTGSTMFGPLLIHIGQALKDTLTFLGLYLTDLYQIYLMFVYISLVRGVVLKLILSRTFPGQENSCGVELPDRRRKIKT